MILAAQYGILHQDQPMSRWYMIFTTGITSASTLLIPYLLGSVNPVEPRIYLVWWKWIGTPIYGLIVLAYDADAFESYYNPINFGGCLEVWFILKPNGQTGI